MKTNCVENRFWNILRRVELGAYAWDALHYGISGNIKVYRLVKNVQNRTNFEVTCMEFINFCKI